MNLEQLYEYLKANNISNIEQLLNQIELSESTIRRRLKQMQEVGLIKLSHGGHIKIISSPNVSVSDEFRYQQNQAQKIRIAIKAASEIEDGDIIFLDNGTTVRHMLKYLRNRQVTIYTNGYHHIEEAKKFNLELNVIPGRMIASEASIVGEAALMYLSTINFDKCFIGANGYHDEMGITTPNLSEANLKNHALASAINGYILIDQTKANKVSKYKICELDTYKLITE